MDPHPESATSSPRSRPDPPPDDHLTNLPPVPGSASKLRLMCSYNGHIIPRPHDKSLCYVGGDTRIVVVDRRSSLADLHARLSHTLLNGRHFTLKYQLPSEDLDSLVSLATDEDLENMIEEYDRTAHSPLKPSRLRLFLFPSMPETAASMGSLLDDAKSETWFVDALNGAGLLLPRGLSESAAIDTLLELNDDSGGDVNVMNDSDVVGRVHDQLDTHPSNERKNIAKSSSSRNNNGEEVVVMETSSSFGSSVSTPPSNLPPIKVRAGDGYNVSMMMVDEQLISSSHVTSTTSAVGLGNVIVASQMPVDSNNNMGGGRVVCDDERWEKSDQGTIAPTGLRKKPPLPLPLQPVQRKFVDMHNLPSPDSKQAGPYSLPSPDSVASDSSIASAGSLSKHTIYQEAAHVQHLNRENRVPTPLLDPKMTNIIQEPTPHHLESIPVLPPQHQHQHQHQQQFFHPSPPPHYIHQHSYYPPMYLHPQTQPPHIQHLQTDHHQPYPIYYLPPLTQNPNTTTTTTTNNNMVSYPEAVPPHYPTTKPEMAASNMHPTAGSSAPPVFVQVPTNQYQQQYNNNNTSNAGVGPCYGYDQYPHPHVQDQVYYGRQLASTPPPPPPSQYQTMTPAAAVMLSQASSSQMPPDGTSQQP